MVMDVYKQYKPHIVVNLAAQAGVRYSIENPDAYIQSNIIGFPVFENTEESKNKNYIRLIANDVVICKFW